MIKYQLLCDCEHDFEGWFRDSADYDAQSKDGLVECPICGSDEVRKAVMAPAVRSSRNSSDRQRRLREITGDMAKAVERARDYVEKNFDYVGDKFPEEARKIHYGEKEERGIYGEASGKEVKEMVDEGIKLAPLPVAKKNTDKAGLPKVSGAGAKKLDS
ncbi:MAG: DUF1178 family protein [Marinicaulis sp.]|nr:DUF1178 family protein [Marinicaulis sp.]NNL89648.1 DUF1178 family protein [Marinicaulis sp.]